MFILINSNGVNIFFTFFLAKKNKATFLVFIFCFLLSYKVRAQDLNFPKDSVPKAGNVDLAKKVIEKDLIDISQKILKIFINRKMNHPILADSSKKESDVFFAFLPAVGYALQTGVTGIVATNISFYTSKKNKNIRLSSFTINPAFSLEHQIMVPVQSNIWLNNNKINLLGDWRYYLYPTTTYGLGGHSSLSDADLIKYSYVKVYQEVSKRLLPNFYVGVGYGLDWHFDIKEEGSGINFQGYNDNKKTTLSSGPLLSVTYDSRSNINNPQTGNYANVVLRNSLVEFGANNNWQSLQLDLRKFVKFNVNGRHILAFWSYNWFTFGGKAPYFDLPSTGWDTYSNTGRGYIQGRLRGTNMLYIESEYRFTITKNGLFGGVVFANAESVTDYSTNKFTTILPATGLGIRLKINKVSKVNLAIDYAWGVGGSRGVFFNLAELF